MRTGYLPPATASGLRDNPWTTVIAPGQLTATDGATLTLTDVADSVSWRAAPDMVARLARGPGIVDGLCKAVCDYCLPDDDPPIYKGAGHA